MQGRGRGQLPPFYKAATLLLRDSVSASACIASVTYDDPNGSWESWEPGAGWGSVAGGAGGARSAAPPNKEADPPVPVNDVPKSEPSLRWDEDSDTNLRHPKQLPRTLITMSELDWEDSEECATELWQHPQRSRVSREAHARAEARGMRPQLPDPSRRAPAQEARAARGATRAPSAARSNGSRPEPPRTVPPAARVGVGVGGYSPQRAAEPTARWNTAAQRTSAPQRLPQAPPPRAAEPVEAEPQASTERRGRTTTQPGAAPQHATLQQPHQTTPAALSSDAAHASALSADPRSAYALSAAQASESRLGTTLAFEAGVPPLQLPAARVAAPPRSLTQTQVSGFGAAPMRPTFIDHPPPPAGRSTVAPNALPAAPPARPEAAPAQQAAPIESLRQRLVTPRMLPPREPRAPQTAGHTPTIIGTPAVAAGRAAAEPRASQNGARMQPPAASHAPVSSQAIEQLQDQLLEAMARARVQEARAAEAEKSVEQVEEQLEAIVRSQMTESEQVRDQLRNTVDQLRVTEARAVAAERRSMAPRPESVLHISDAELAPRHHKQNRANLILSGLLASSLSFGGAAYFMFYAPLQTQLAALEQQRTQDAQAQSNALTNLKAQSAAERQGIEAQNAELRSQLEAARTEALAMNAADEGKRGGRSRRASSAAADAADDAPTPAGTRSARAIERRMRRSRGAAPADGDEAPAPRASKASAPRDSDDPLGGI